MKGNKPEEITLTLERLKITSEGKNKLKPKYLRMKQDEILQECFNLPAMNLYEVLSEVLCDSGSGYEPPTYYRIYRWVVARSPKQAFYLAYLYDTHSYYRVDMRDIPNFRYKTILFDVPWKQGVINTPSGMTMNSKVKRNW